MPRKRYFWGNWKMHFSPSEAINFTNNLINELEKFNVDFFNKNVVGIAPPFTNLYPISQLIQHKNFHYLKLSAQNMCWERKGAFTGEVSGEWFKDVSCEYVILGHSERRWILGETDEMVNKKIKMALELSLKPIICIGEKLEEREKNLTNTILDKQLHNALYEVPENRLANIIIAYEPVWAIGTGKNATPKEEYEAHLYIRNWLREKYPLVSEDIPVIYGGSVNPSNAQDLIKVENVDGFLIGGASLKLDSFINIIKTCQV